MVHYTFKGSQVIIFKKNIVFQFLKIVSVLENNVEPDEMPHNMWHFIWVFTVCQSNCLGVSGP